MWFVRCTALFSTPTTPVIFTSVERINAQPTTGGKMSQQPAITDGLLSIEQIVGNKKKQIARSCQFQKLHGSNL